MSFSCLSASQSCFILLSAICGMKAWRAGSSLLTARRIMARKQIMKKARRYNRALASAQEEIFLSGEEAKGYRKQLWLKRENGIMGYLEIPSIRVYLPIYHGTEEAVLLQRGGAPVWTSAAYRGKERAQRSIRTWELPSTKLFTEFGSAERMMLFRCIFWEVF